MEIKKFCKKCKDFLPRGKTNYCIIHRHLQYAEARKRANDKQRKTKKYKEYQKRYQKEYRLKKKLSLKNENTSLNSN